MIAKECYAEDLRKEVYIVTNDLPVIAGYTAEQWRQYAEGCEDDDEEEWTAYAIARWLDAYEETQ